MCFVWHELTKKLDVLHIIYYKFLICIRNHEENCLVGKNGKVRSSRGWESLLLG